MSVELSNIFNLKQKNIVITGAAGLLGKKHSEAVAAYGGNPILLDLIQSDVDILAEELNTKFDVRSAGFSVDITDEHQIVENVQQIKESAI